MVRIDGYLSRKLQRAWPDGVVYCDDSGVEERWYARRTHGGEVGLGASFHDAHQAVVAIIAANTHENVDNPPEAE